MAVASDVQATQAQLDRVLGEGVAYLFARDGRMTVCIPENKIWPANEVLGSLTVYTNGFWSADELAPHVKLDHPDWRAMRQH